MKIAEAVKVLQKCRWFVDGKDIKVVFDAKEKEAVTEAIGLMDFPRRKYSISGAFFYPASGKRESDRAIVKVTDILENYGIDYAEQLYRPMGR